MTKDFTDKIDANVAQAERILYEVFKPKDDDFERTAFENTVKFFGINYNRTSYLFFLKNREKYLPIKPELFKERFSWLNIRTNCCNGCTWEHYQEFIQIIREIQERIQPNFKQKISLLDAQSFVWCMYLIQEELEKEEAEEADKGILLKKAKERSGQRFSARKVTVEQKYRDPFIAEWAKRRTDGICLLCGEMAPFHDKKGRPYLESHHIQWLLEGGTDSIDNVVALCPNCHRKMHELKGEPEEIVDRAFLSDCVADYFKKENADILCKEINL